MLKLYYSPGACSLASHIALNEAGAVYEAMKVDFKAGEQKTPAYLAINPKGKVPVLVTDQGALTENPVILGYIARAYPDAGLAETDSFKFGDTQAFNMYLASTIHPIFGRLFKPMNLVSSDAAIAEVKARVPQSLKEALALVEDKLSDGRDWVHGARYSISDPYLHVFSRWLERDGTGGIAGFPRIHAHRTRMQARPAVQKTLAEEGLEPI